MDVGISGASPRERFAFGENWRSFANAVGEGQIASATDALRDLLGPSALRGKTMLDIGCGSGLHALAALRLGAAQVTAIDIDPVSVATSTTLLEAKAPGGPWRTAIADVFALGGFGTFDVVYSWGVLHHTGDVDRAIRCAAACVRPGGIFCIAIYRKTPLCGFWRAEKRFYSRCGPLGQRALRALYIGLVSASCLLRGRRVDKMRGMDFATDVHDWLGGYPYESLSPDEVRGLLDGCAMTELRTRLLPGQPFGLTGSGCDEYVFRRAC